MLETEKSRSQTGDAYRHLRRAIVVGDLNPGARLSPGDLSARFGFGPTPIREALARLAAENLAIAIEQRGFRVAPLSSHELRELLALRLGFERDAVLRSMQAGGVEWEAGIVAAFHRLSATRPPQPGMDYGELAVWSMLHDAFHAALMAGYDAPWLNRFHGMSVEQIERYRIAILRYRGQVRAASPPARQLERILSHQDHASLRDAVLSRDIDMAQLCLTRHIGETADVFAAMFEAVEQRIAGDVSSHALAGP